MSEDKKLELLKQALLILATSSTDALTRCYCVTMLVEVGAEDLLEQLLVDDAHDLTLA